MRYNTLKNNIETKLCYLQIGEEWVSFIPENQKISPIELV
jgi:hypothetical protein